MSVFKNTEATWQRLDYRLLLNSPIALFWHVEIFEKQVAWFQDNGYRVASFDAASWDTESTFHQDLYKTLNFPGYYGMNLNALNDCLFDMDLLDCDGVAIAVRNYHEFSHSLPRVAQDFLDIIANNSRRNLLFGKRLVGLFQTNIADAAYAPLGAMHAIWNPEEWPNSKRGQ